MVNFQSAIDATTVSIDSLGSAEIENAKRADSIEAKTKGMQAAFVELVTGDGGLKTFLTIVLDITTGTLNLISSLGGLPSILLTILSITSLIKGQSIVLGISKLISAIPMLITSLKGLQFMYSSATNSIIVSNQAINLSIPVIGLAIAAISALIMAWNGYNSAQEKRKQAAIENARVLNQEIDGIQSAIDLIKDEKTSREQIVSAVNNVNSAYADELKSIENVNDLRQKAIDLLDEEAIKKAKQYTSENLSGYKEALSNKTNGSDSSQKSVLKAYNYSHNTKMPEALQFGYDDSKLNTEGQVKKFEEIIEMIQKTSGYADKYSKYLGLAENALADLSAEQSSTDLVISEFNDNLAIQGMRWDEIEGKIVPMTQAQIDEYNSKLLMKEGAEEFGYALDEESDAMDTNTDSVQEQIDAHQALMDSTSDVLSSMEMLNDASQEQAENGELSAETAMKLIEAGYAGALVYDTETNAVKLDAEATKQLLMAKLESAKAGLTLANSGLAGVILEEGRAAALAAQSMNGYAYSKSLAAIAGATTDMQENQKQIDLINQQLKDVEKNGLRGFGGVSNGASGASKSVQTLEDKVKSATTYMKSMIDKQIKALNEAKEAEEERVDAEIDALKERRDAQEAYWDAKIEKVKKANEILEEQNKLQQLEQNLALAKSKKVKVFTGEGFEYKEDVDAVSKASQELSDYKREQQIAKEVETLEKLKKKALDNIDKQIKGWEKYKKEMQKNFDAQIKALENYKDQLDDLTNGYKEQQDKLIAEQLLGAKLEQGNWQLRIDNLKKFVKDYNGELSGIKTDVDTKGTEKSTDGSKAGMPSNIPKHASGSYAVPTDEIAIVGDSPNRELSIGSKLNMGGVMARLKGGTGVMPNTLTERLVNMAYNTNTSPTSNSNSSIININVDKVELPSVTNGKTFVNELLGLKTLAIQTSS